MTRKKRMGAFLFFDKDGIVGEYVDYLLEKMNEYLERLIIICNGEVTDEGERTLRRHSLEIIFRENIGYDASGWKELFTRHLDCKEMEEYDEIIIFNDSFFGPLFPLNEMFTAMDNRKDIDFLGITRHEKCRDPYKLSKYGYFPEHIQSYYIAIRKDMFTSDFFKSYWENLPPTDSLEEAISYFEITFTKSFEDKGFRWDVYIDTNEHIRDNLRNSDQSFFNADRLIIDNRNPFIKRKPLYVGSLGQLRRNDNGNASRCIEYITEHTDYPEKLIWKQLIRTVDMRDLYETMHFDYIISEAEGADSKERSVALITQTSHKEMWLNALQ